jgi:hypothetical protein
MTIPWNEGAGLRGQLRKGDQNHEVEGREGSLHEDMAVTIEAENCEGSQVEDSKVCADRLGVIALVGGRTGRAHMVLEMTHSQRVLRSV